MAKRFKTLVQSFAYTDTARCQEWINEKALINGNLLGSHTGSLAADATSVTGLDIADPGIDIGRHLRVGHNLEPIIDVQLSLTVARGFGSSSAEDHVAGQEVFTEGGELIGTVKTAITANSTTTLVIGGCKAAFTVADNVKAGDEVFNPSAIATTITITRQARAVALAAGAFIYDDNGPYKVDHISDQTEENIMVVFLSDDH